MSPSPSDVSVVTVNWNGRAHLEKLLPSLEATVFGEVLVVDNGSIDSTRQKVEGRVGAYPPLRYFFQPNRKQSSACNLGASKARGGYFALSG